MLWLFFLTFCAVSVHAALKHCACNHVTGTNCEIENGDLSTAVTMYSCAGSGTTGDPCTCGAFDPIFKVSITECDDIPNKKLLVQFLAGTSNPVNTAPISSVTFKWYDGSTSNVVDTSSPYQTTYTPLSNEVMFNATARNLLISDFEVTVLDDDGETWVSNPTDTSEAGCATQTATHIDYDTNQEIYWYPLSPVNTEYFEVTMITGGGQGGGGGAGGRGSGFSTGGDGRRGGGAGSGGVLVFNGTISDLRAECDLFLGRSIAPDTGVFWPVRTLGDGTKGSTPSSPGNGQAGKNGATGPSSTESLRGSWASFACIGSNAFDRDGNGNINWSGMDDSSNSDAMVTYGEPAYAGGGGYQNGNDANTGGGKGEGAYVYRFSSTYFTQISFTSNDGTDGGTLSSGGTGGSYSYSGFEFGSNRGQDGGRGGAGVSQVASGALAGDSSAPNRIAIFKITYY